MLMQQNQEKQTGTCLLSLHYVYFRPALLCVCVCVCVCVCTCVLCVYVCVVCVCVVTESSDGNLSKATVNKQLIHCGVHVHGVL